MTPEEAFKKEFVEYSRKNVKETELWRPLSDKTFAEHFYLVAIKWAARFAEEHVDHDEHAQWNAACRNISKGLRGEWGWRK